MSSAYRLDGDTFVIEQYNTARPFASFLPGIAGFYGKPLWAFYVNRGQCVASFGMDSKDGAIMEYYPATTAYRRVTLEGFRTFIAYESSGGRRVYEPFRIPDGAAKRSPRQTLFISPHEIRIEEESAEHALRVEAVFFTIPGEDFPALARTVKVTNLGSRPRRLEIVDGMPKLSPYGLNEWFMKHMSRTIEAWMETSGAAAKKPFYRLRVDAADVAETKYITAGNFYLSVRSGAARPAIIVDPRTVFGTFSDLSSPGALYRAGGVRVPPDQVDKNITPAAFSAYAAHLAAGRTSTLYSLIGHADSQAHLDRIDRRISERFFARKRAANAAETARIAGTVRTVSADAAFDAYVRQTNLDNILRGGLPVTIGSGKVAYVFNRKHGDLERDYNNFTVRPEYFAQGNGNYRDANQNRRLSVWLNPDVGTKDIRDFYDLVQLDGYNPLVIKGDRYSVPKAAHRRRLIRAHLAKADRKAAGKLLAGHFTIGELVAFAERSGCLGASGRSRQAFLDAVTAVSTSSLEADHGEGFWVDHWSYNLDLVESYLALFPERKQSLLFREKVYRSYDNDHIVRPRAGKAVRDAHGRVRQYHAVTADPEKKKRIASRAALRTWVRTGHGTGGIYTCTLAAKMLIITANKIASLDPSGAGIEMEADKPGWCDSMNGLPGLFGSSSCETFELARQVRFLIEAVNAAGSAVAVAVPAEAAAFIRGLVRLFDTPSADRVYWERSNALKEAYRASVRMGVSGSERSLDAATILAFLAGCSRKLTAALGRLYGPEGIPYTYFVNEPKRLAAGGTVSGFTHRALPLFLEGVVHALKVQPDAAAARALYARVRRSALYDAKLGMYRLNASLAGESLEVGRSRAFTPGWLENESVWLHMEYKYLLELLKSGLYEEFFADCRTALIPYQDALRYGRSILENSSFIASSRFFDRELVGSGFYARLSGATVEFLHMVQVMGLGTEPFVLDGGKLAFRPRPALQGTLFTKEARRVDVSFRGGRRQVSLAPHSYGFTVFGSTLIVYRNPLRRDTFGPRAAKPTRFILRYAAGKRCRVDGESLGEPFSKDLRDGRIEEVTILLG